MVFNIANALEPSLCCLTLTIEVEECRACTGLKASQHVAGVLCGDDTVEEQAGADGINALQPGWPHKCMSI